MPYDCAQLFPRYLPGIRQVYLVVQPRSTKVVLISVLRYVTVHQRNASRLVIEGAYVHHLHAESLVNRQKLRLGKIPLFLLRSFFHSPVEILLGYEIRQPYHRYPVELVLMCKVYAVYSFLPPETL